MSEKIASVKNPLDSGPLIVAAFSGYAYSVAFAYEWGYLKTFGVPWSLIDINLITVLGAAGALLGLLGVPFFYTWLIYAMWPGLDPMHPIALRFKRMSIVTFLVLGYFLIGTEHKMWSLIPFGFIAFSEFVAPLLIHRKVKGYIEKLREDDRTAYIETGLTRMAQSLGHTKYLALIFAIVIIHLSTQAGGALAKAQTKFLTINDDLIILRRYSDHFVCVRLIQGTNEVQSSIILVPQNTFSEILILQPKEIGPLVVRQDSEKQPHVEGANEPSF